MLLSVPSFSAGQCGSASDRPLAAAPCPAGRYTPPAAPPAAADLATFAGLAARLTPASVLALAPGAGYLVIRRRCHSGGGSSPRGQAAARAAAPYIARGSGNGGRSCWAPEQERVYQELLRALRRAVAAQLARRLARQQQLLALRAAAAAAAADADALRPATPIA